MSRSDSVTVRALKTIQGEGIEVFSFFLPASKVLEVADISRIERKTDGELKGFQRSDIRKHVKSIVEFLDRAPALFPNAIILALSPAVRFSESRGPRPKDLTDSATMGTLQIPMGGEGRKAAWIVDGQQRSLALSQTKNKDLAVPIVGFVSQDVAVHREQFILVNKAKPLSPRLVDELLPEVDTYIPSDLAPRKIPSEICNLLNTASDSPFHRLIKRPSTRHEKAVVTDRALIESIRKSIANPNGALAPYRYSQLRKPDVDSMYRLLKMYWSAVKEVFPGAWGLPPTQSRLMHSTGIAAMGTLMDRLVMRSAGSEDVKAFIVDSLKSIAPKCHWTAGRWPDIDKLWNEIEFTTKDVRLLAQQLVILDHQVSQGKVV